MDLTRELSRALHRRGDPLSAHEFLEVLYEAVGGLPIPLTAGEQEFLLTNAGLDEVDLSEQASAKDPAGHRAGSMRTRCCGPGGCIVNE